MNLILRKSILFAMVLLSAAALSQAQATVEPPLITVNGQAEVNVAPDEVVFTLEVKKRDKDLLVAKEQNDQIVRGVMELARKYGIPSQNVQTDYISVEPKYRTESKRSVDGVVTESKAIFDGYEVSKTVVIKLKDISRFEGLLSDLLKSSVDRVRDVDFRTTAIRKYKDQARALAIRAAQEKAIAMTKEIGQSVGKAYSIREQGYSYAGSSMSNVSSNNMATIEGGDSDDETSTIAPGMIKISARVTVSFRLL